MCNVRILKKLRRNKKKIGNFNTLLGLLLAERSKAFGLRNLCYSKIYAVMLLGYRIAGISRKLESGRKYMPCAQMLHI